MEFKTGFDLIKPWFPPALVSDRYKSRIAAIALLFDAVSVVSVECRMSKEDTVDLALGFETDLPMAQMGNFFKNQKNEFDSISGKVNRLIQLMQFFIAPSPSQQFLKQSIKGFWLNFDLSEGSDIPLPWVYLVFREVKLGGGFYATLLNKTFFALHLQHDQPTLDRMEAVVKAIPDHAYLLGVAIPTQANLRTFRVVIYGMNFRQILDFLKNIHWPGDPEDLALQLNPVEVHCDTLGLLLDFSNGILLDRLGIEMLIQQNNAIKHVDQLIKFMLGLDVCDTSKARIVHDWICRVASTEDLPVYPESIRTITQWINHFKLVYESGKPLAAKCYFGSAERM